MILYLELLGLVSKKEIGGYHYSVRARAYLFDKKRDRQVDERWLTDPDGDHSPPSPQQMSVNFFWKRFRPSSTLDAGPYRLLVEVEDLLSGHTATESLDIEIVP